MWAVFAQVMDALKRIGSDADNASPTGSVHAKLKDIRENTIGRVAVPSLTTIQYENTTETNTVTSFNSNRPVRKIIIPIPGIVRLEFSFRKTNVVTGASSMTIRRSGSSNLLFREGGTTITTFNNNDFNNPTNVAVNIPIKAGDSIDLWAAATGDATTVLLNTRVRYDIVSGSTMVFNFGTTGMWEAAN
jgi:hypothetical protein